VYRDIERRGSCVRMGDRNGREGSGKMHKGSLVGHGDDLMEPKTNGSVVWMGSGELSGGMSTSCNVRVGW